MTVTPEQVNHKEVGRRLPIRHRGAFEHQPPRREVGMHELIDEPRLAYARFPDECYHLAMPRPGLFQRLLQNRQLLLPSDEAGESARRTGLQTPPDRTGSEQLKDLHGLGEPL